MALGMNLARISPGVCLFFASSHLAGTGLFDYLDAGRWRAELDQVNRDVYYSERYARKAFAKAEGRDPQKTGLEPLDLNLLPDFNYKGIKLDQAIKSSLTDILILGLELVLMFMFCYLMFIRMANPKFWIYYDLFCIFTYYLP